MGLQVNCNFMFMWSGLWGTHTYYLENVGCLKLSWLNIHYSLIHLRSVESSWRASSELLVNIAGHGENTGFEVPCLIVAAKDDLESFTSAIQDSIRVFFVNLLIYVIVFEISHSCFSILIVVWLDNEIFNAVNSWNYDFIWPSD